MDLLPDELLLRILDLLPARAIIAAGKVCVRWGRLSHDALLWRHRTYKIRYHTEPEALEFFRDTPALRSVSFSRCVSSVVMRCLATHCLGLTSLQLYSEQGMGYYALRALTRNCVHIAHLQVSSVVLQCARRARLVAQMPRLEKLVVVGEPEPLLRELATGCLALRSLDLVEVEGCLADLGVPLLERLEELAVQWDYVTPDIRHCAKNLRRLRLERFTSAMRGDVELALDLKHLRGLTHVTATDLSATPVLMISLLPPGLRVLRLEQPCYSVHDGLLLDMSRLCPELEEINICGSEFVTSLGLRDLWRLRRLRVLNLSQCCLLDGGTAVHLSRCKALEELYLEGVDLDQLQPGVEHLLKLRNLRVLSFQSWSARDWFPWHLVPKSFPRLERLILGPWDTQEPTFPDALKAAMPRTHIQWSFTGSFLSFFHMKLDMPKPKKTPKPEEPDLDLFIFRED